MTRFSLFRGSSLLSSCWLWCTLALLFCSRSLSLLLEEESMEAQRTGLVHHHHHDHNLHLHQGLILHHHSLHRNLMGIAIRATTTTTARAEDLLQQRKDLESFIQIQAFKQFDGHKKTGKAYNVSISDPKIGSGSNFQAIRLRSGSLKRYGLTLNEYILPSGCQILVGNNSDNSDEDGSSSPSLIPERVLLVYSRLVNTSLYQGLVSEAGYNYTIVPPVVSMLVYDATYLNRTEALVPLSLSATASPIKIHLYPSSNSSIVCISFDSNSTNVSYSEPAGGVCEAGHLGSFAYALGNASSSAPGPSVSPSEPSSRTSARWKVVVGGVVGGVALIVLVCGLGAVIGSKWRQARFAKMEHQADQGEALQTTVIRNSRAPAAPDTRTQPSLERDYTV